MCRDEIFYENPHQTRHWILLSYDETIDIIVGSERQFHVGVEVFSVAYVAGVDSEADKKNVGHYTAAW